MEQPTELIALLNTKNNDMTLPTATYTAAAVGYIYLDDGTSASDIARVDVFVKLETDGSATVNFKTIAQPKNLTNKGKAAKISQITFLWASSTKFETFVGKTTEIYQISGGKATLPSPVYDLATDTLTVSVVGLSDQQTWNFWEIDYISLGK